MKQRHGKQRHEARRMIFAAERDLQPEVRTKLPRYHYIMVRQYAEAHGWSIYKAARQLLYAGLIYVQAEAPRSADLEPDDLDQLRSSGLLTED